MAQQSKNIIGYFIRVFISILICYYLCLSSLITISYYRLTRIHKNNYIHRDLHSGNILLLNESWYIGDFGLSQPAENTSLNNEIYGVHRQSR